MKMIPGQSNKGCNCPNDPGKNITSSAAPKTITDGTSLKTGYGSVGNPGRSPNADSNSRNR